MSCSLRAVEHSTLLCYVSMRYSITRFGVWRRGETQASFSLAPTHVRNDINVVASLNRHGVFH